MISLPEVMQLTRTIGAELLFDDTEAEAYYDLCISLPNGAFVLEIGLSFGRSTSIVAQVGAHKGFLYTGVDPVMSEKWLNMMKATGLPRTQWSYLQCRSADAELIGPFHMALIDGDHDEDAVVEDCRKIAPLIVEGGYICLHDYGRESLPGVKAGADAVLTDWELVRVAGTLAVWRKNG